MEDRPNQDGGHKYLFPESPRGIGTEVDDNVRPLAPLRIANLWTALCGLITTRLQHGSTARVQTTFRRAIVSIFRWKLESWPETDKVIYPETASGTNIYSVLRPFPITYFVHFQLSNYSLRNTLWLDAFNRQKNTILPKSQMLNNYLIDICYWHRIYKFQFIIIWHKRISL